MSSTREHGRIASTFYGKEDHGILTCMLHFEGDVGQGFGGLVLDSDTGPDFVRSICEFFGVEKLEQVEGKPCYALRSFPYHNAAIEGLELEGGARFTLTAWRRRKWPESGDPLAHEKLRVRREISFLQRRLDEEQARLQRLEKDYVAW